MNPTLVVTQDYGGIQCKSKQLIKEFSQPDHFTRGHTSSNVLCLGKCSKPPTSTSCSSRILRKIRKRNNTQKCSFGPPHCLHNQHQYIHVVSHLWQCISTHEWLCNEDISTNSWHQSSVSGEAQPYVDSTC